MLLAGAEAVIGMVIKKLPIRGNKKKDMTFLLQVLV
jgi:hypothetical protein